jgi:hypothetical protein
LESTSVDELIAVLEDLASSLAAGDAPEKDVPHYKSPSRARR